MKVLSVSQLVSKIKSTLEGEYHNQLIEGEVSNLTKSASGHWYFSLSDHDSTLSVAFFKGDALRNPFIRKVANGNKVRCFGNISVYARRGTFQLIGKQLFPIGQGDLKAQFEALKQKLYGEGLFNPDSKKLIPRFPKAVAVITAPQGAAWKDFSQIFLRRSKWMKLTLIPTLVQGDQAPKALINSLKNILKSKIPYDVVVLTRGGGSLEDLWAFNDEELVRFMAAYPLPLISAVGHEIDTGLSDYVADKRCETPSAAAEFLTEGQQLLEERLDRAGQRLKQDFSHLLLKFEKKLRQFHPVETVKGLYEKHQQRSKRLESLGLAYRASELLGLSQYQLLLDDHLSTLFRFGEKRLTRLNDRVEQSFSLLKALSPQLVLERGFTYILSDDQVVDSAKNFDRLEVGKEIKVVFHDESRVVIK